MDTELGISPFNLAFSLITAFLFYCYTDVAGISAAAVGTSWPSGRGMPSPI